MLSMAQPVEPILHNTAEVRELLQSMTVESQVKPAKEIPPKDGNSSDGSGIGVNGASKSSIDKHVKTEPSIYYAANGYVLPQGYFYGGYDLGEWDDYARYIGIDPSELHSLQGVYGENGSMIYHPSYGYASQSPYGPYPPTIGVDGQLYGPAAFQYTGHLYHQSGVHYYPSPPGSVTGEALPAGSKESGLRGADGSNGAGGYRPRPGFPMGMVSPHPYARGLVMHGQDGRASYDAKGGLTRSDAGKAPERKQSSVSQASSRPAPAFQVRLSAPQQQVAAGPGALGRGYPPLSRVIPHNIGREAPPSGGHSLDVMPNGRSWVGTEKGKQKGRAVLSFGNGMGNSDFMNEQNRGPRTARIKGHRPIPGIFRQTKGPGESSHAEILKDQYNKPDFVTKYSEASFFVIKSYSEDDIHKSIKYNVWASTPNGNKRLDAAFQVSRAKSAPKLAGCPIFLFFSVNASGQFCGVAEMTGPVDFLKSMDFWQQDKWNGCFTVKWHIIKDVPNSQFRHIILENNDNKPVTNSRDTQEVKCEQGVEMLDIFKNYATKTSILDDFPFYESRQKSMQEKKVRQQAQQRQQVNKYTTHVEGKTKIVTEIAKGLIPAETATHAAAGVPKANGQTMSSEEGVSDFACNMNGNVAVEERNSPAVKV